MIKTTLDNHIDTRISKIIDKEIQIRLGKPVREWKRRDYRLDNILKQKEITLQEIKEQRLSLLSIHTKLIEDVYSKNPVFKTFYIYPAIELKVISIADFVIKKQINTHLIEMTKGMWYKTEEERIHRDTNEKSTFFEFDMYGIAKYFGQETGRERLVEN